MNKQSDWHDRLDAYVLANMHAPFDWQDHNCTTFAAGWVTEATGQVLDVPTTQTAKAALRAIAGVDGLLADAKRQLGDGVPALFAQTGDVVLLALEDGRKAFGVCLGGSCAAPGPAGLMFVPITQAEAAWRV